MRNIKNLLDNIIDPSLDWKIQLLSRWQEVTGGLKTKIRLEKIEQDSLIIGVYDSHWMQEIYLLSNILLKKINNIIGEDKIKKIRFKLVEEKKHKNIIAHLKEDSKSYNIDAKYKKALNNIKDKQLQEVLEKYLIQCLKNSN